MTSKKKKKERNISELEDPDELLELGNTHYNKGELDQAIKHYKKAVDVKPDYHAGFYGLGIAYFGKGQFVEAIECFKKAVELKPDYHEAWAFMGNAYDDKGEFAEAIECFKKAVELKPDYHEAWTLMGNAYDDKGEFAQAIECFKKAVELKPDYYGAWNNLGITYAQKGEFDESIMHYKKAIELKPDYHQAWNNMGLAFEDNGELTSALECYQKALEINPDNLLYRKNLELLEKNIVLAKDLDIKEEHLKTGEDNLLEIGKEIKETRKRGESVAELQDKEDKQQKELLEQKLEIEKLRIKNKKLEAEKELYQKNRVLADLESLLKSVMLGQITGEKITREIKFDICKKVKEIDSNYFEKILDNLVDNPSFRKALKDEIKNIYPSDIKEEAIKLLEEKQVREILLGKIKTWLEEAANKIEQKPVREVFHLLLTFVLTLPIILDKIRILYLSANPENTQVLNFAEEIRAIREEIKKAKLRDRFIIHLELAIRVKDLTEPIMEYTPDIVHFSGHGSLDSEIKLLDESGVNAKIVPKTALANMFKQYKDQIRLVVLNACYSEDQAKAIAQHVDCVVGYSRAIEDTAAIEFSRGFYRALGKGFSVQSAIDSGINQIELEDASEGELPHLNTNENVAPEKIYFD